MVSKIAADDEEKNRIQCGEFSIRNKPVITYALSPQRSHLDILGDKTLKFRGPKEIEKILLDFDKKWSEKQNWDRLFRKILTCNSHENVQGRLS